MTGILGLSLIVLFLTVCFITLCSVTYNSINVDSLKMVTQYNDTIPQLTGLVNMSGLMNEKEQGNKQFQTLLTLQWRDSKNNFLFDFQVLNLARSNNFSYKSSVTPDDVVFIITGTRRKKHSQPSVYNLVSAIRTWLVWTKCYYIVVDQPMRLPNEIILRSSRGSYVSDINRQYLPVVWLKENKPELLKKKWFALVDMDTWMNVPALCRYLQDFDPNWNVAIGEMNNFFTANQSQTLQQPGSAKIFSRAAFTGIAKGLPHDCSNDRHGCRDSQTILVQSDRFCHYKVPVEKILNYYALYPPNYVTKISFHHINNHYVKMAITCDVAEEWNVFKPPECDMMRENRKKTYITKLQRSTTWNSDS